MSELKFQCYLNGGGSEPTGIGEVLGHGSSTISEARRLSALRRYGILDTPREAEFDWFTRMAADLCGMPVSLVSLIDKDRQWFKSEVGLDLGGARETPLDVSICKYAILQKGLFEIPDTQQDERFRNNPFVKGAPHLRYYAGALLETPEGLPLGTLCVLDREPRRLTQMQGEALEGLARQLMNLLELRLERRRLGDTLESIGDPMVVVDESLRVTYANEAARVCFTLHGEKMVDLELWDACRISRDRRFASAVNHAIQRREKQETEFFHTSSRKWLSAAVHPSPDGLAIHFRDTTERRAGERAVRSMARESQEQVQRLDTLRRAALLLRRDDFDVEELLARVADVVPEAMRQPDEVEVRIRMGEVTYETEAFPENPAASIGVDFHTDAGVAGGIEVALLGEIHSRGPSFTKDERMFVESLADMLRIHFERVDARETLARSERHYRLLFEINPKPMWIYDLETLRFVEVNAAMIETYGFSRHELVGASVGLIRPEEEMETFVNWVSNYTDETVDRAGLWTHRTKDGRLLRVDITSHPIELPGGRKGRMVLGVDMTERLGALEKLQRSETMLRMASQVGRMGAWQIELPSKSNRWSEEVWAIHEVGPDFNPDEADLISFYAPEEHPRLLRIFGDCMTEGKPFDEELKFITARGRNLWVRVMGEAVRDEEGNILRIQGAIQDIDEEHRLRAESSALARRLKGTLESITEGFIMLDREWRFTFINPMAEQMIDRPPEEVLGKVLWDLYPQLEETSFGQAYRRALVEQVPVMLEDYYAPRDRWMEMRFYPSEEGLAVYLQNVTERYRSRQALVLSEERFSLLAKATNDAMWDWSPDAESVWWNDGLTTLFGYQPEEVGTPELWLELIHPADRPRASAALYNALEGDGRVWSADYRFLRKDGSYASVLDRGYIIRNEKGETTRMIGGMTDLTERLEAQEALRESEERHRQTAGLLSNVLDSSLDVICSFDSDGNFLQVSAACESVWGYKPEQLLGKSYTGLIMLEDQMASAEVMASVLAGRAVRNFENRVMRDDGEVVWMQWSARWSPADRIIFCVARDITEKRQLERQFMRAQRVESIGTLAGGIAHDLNNMLAPIMMSVDLLKMGAEPKDLLEVIGTSARRGADMVAQVLSFARGMDGRKGLVQPDPLIRELIKIVTDTFPRTIHYDWDLEPGLWALDADPTQLHQLLINLCVNARDAMPEGGQLTLHAGNAMVDEAYASQNVGASAGPYLRIRLEDTGHGMSPEIMDKIFDPFFTTKETGKGTGLGLSTALTIVRSHGGFMRVSSRPGIGTQFLIYLPAKPEAEEVPLPEVQKTTDGSGEMILIVDDEPAIRSVAKQILEQHGYRTLVAANGVEALAIYKETPGIDIVLTDMSMPEMDGHKLIRALREANPEVRIIATSGLTDEETVRGEGVGHFLRKPYTVESLLKVVAER